MHTNRTIADIADHLGFSAPSDFYRLFRKFYSISPRQARQKKGLR
jgi:AraC-like DNA-binding protein